ncbi:MAG: DUF3368 domain-containing protein [Cyclobacteriaceae bacterium]
MPKIITDTSCLILLSKIGQLNLLNELYSEVWVTQEIVNEYGAGLPKFIKISRVKPKFVRLLWQIDKGEASAISLALESGYLLAIDDLKARNVAFNLKLKITGTLGLLVKAKKSGLIDSVKDQLKAIEKTDFRLSEDVKKIVLIQANELN